MAEEELKQEEVPAEEIEGEELSDEEAESENLPVPTARVGKIIKQTMNEEEHFTLSIEHFNKAARKYREIALNEKRIRRIKKVLEKQRAELDEIITEIELELPPGESKPQGTY